MHNKPHLMIQIEVCPEQRTMNGLMLRKPQDCHTQTALGTTTLGWDSAWALLPKEFRCLCKVGLGSGTKGLLHLAFVQVPMFPYSFSPLLLCSL